MSKTDVFISYARRDGTILAQKLAQGLRNAGLNVFLDQDSIPPGANWDQTLDDALEEANHILVVLTPFSVVSEEVTAEWRPMLSKGKNVVPLLYLSCEIPRRLSMRQYIDFQNEAHYQIAFSELVEALKQFTPGQSIEFELTGEQLLQRGLAHLEAGQLQLSARDYAMALRDADPIIRARAARLLGKAKELETLPLIVDTLTKESESSVKVELAQTLRRFAEITNWQSVLPELPTYMMAFLQAPESDVRREAIRVLAYGNMQEGVSKIEALLLHDPSEGVRTQAAFSLGRLKASSALGSLAQALLNDVHEETRKAAAHALAVIDDSQAIPALTIAAKKDRSSEVKAAASEALDSLRRR
jgi:hypothetical protein